MNAIARIRASSTKLVRAPDGLIYKIRRVDARLTAEHGTALEAAMMESVLARMTAEDLLEAKKTKESGADDLIAEQVAAMGPEERAKHDAKVAHQAAHAQLLGLRKKVEDAGRSAKIVAQFAEVMHVYVCAGVVGVSDGAGVPSDAVLVSTPEGAREMEAENAAAWAAECKAVGHDVPRYPPAAFVATDPIRFVTKETDERDDALWVSRLPEDTITHLGGAVKELSATSSPEVLASFRGGSGAVRVGGSAGPEVRTEAERDADG